MIDAAAAYSPPAGSDFYYATLYFPPPVRTELHLLEALRRTIAHIPRSCSDRGVAHIKLAWWHDEIERLAAGQARHVITQSIAALGHDEPGLISALFALVEGVRASLVGTTPATPAAVDTAILATHGGLIEALMRRGRPCAAPAATAVIALAVQLERAAALHGLREHRHDGMIYIADTAFERHGLHPDDIRAAYTSVQIRDLLRDELGTLRNTIDTATAALPATERRGQRLFVTLARIASRNLALSLADDCQLLERRIEITPVEKLWLAWRTRSFG